MNMNNIDFVLANAIVGTTVEEVSAALNASDKTTGIIFDSNGKTFRAVKHPLGVVVEETTNVFNATTPAKEGFTFALPKIPLSVLLQIVSFFRDICSKTGNEVFARIYYDKETGEYIPYVPTQEITKVTVTYNITDERFQDESRYLFVLDIHSHNTMDAFFSGTDNKDERTPGKVYAVVGKLNLPSAMHKIRVFSGTKHIDINLFDVFEKPENKMSIQNVLGTFEYSIPDAEMLTAIFSMQVDYPTEWKDQIVIKAPVIKHSFGGFNPKYQTGISSRQISIDDTFGGFCIDDDDETDDETGVTLTPKSKITTYEDLDDDIEDDPEQLADQFDEAYLQAQDIAAEISDIIESYEVNTSDPIFIGSLKEGLENVGLDRLIKDLNNENITGYSI